MTLVKICGITRLEDALFCAEEGADLLGFIFVRRSPRCISREVCRGLLRGLPSGPVRKVGVFADSPAGEVAETASFCGLDLVQLHGAERPEDFADLEVGVMRSISVTDRASFAGVERWRDVASFFLFDNGAGGTGRPFDWTLLGELRAAGGLEGVSFFLAGGLGPENAADALRLGPDGLDFNSGVESAAGIKDRMKIRRVISIIRSRP